MASHNKILRIGHRGAAGHAPENTLASIQKAIALRCDLVEVDVRRTGDGHLVLLHDEGVDRMTNGKGNVAEMTLEELRRLDAGGRQRIPTLEEALQTANGRVGLILELKAKGLAEEVCRIVGASGFTGRIIYASFLHDELRHIHQAERGASTMVLFKRLPQDPFAAATSLRATYVGLRFDKATKPLVKAFRKAGLVVFSYTVNEPSDIKRVRSLGVDGIISDFPDRVVL